jgi:hypothetical protein
MYLNLRCRLAIVRVAEDMTRIAGEARRHTDLMAALHVACGLVAAIPLMGSALCANHFHTALRNVLSVS